MSGASQLVDVSIIIPTCNRARLLEETLGALGQQAAKCSFEVIVVSDGDDPNTRRLAQSHLAAYPLRWTFKATNEGQAAARNHGAFLADGEVLLFLDDDCSPRQGWLSYHLKHHGSTKDPIVVAGKSIERYDRPARSGIERYLREGRNTSLARMEDCWRRAGRDLEEWVYVGLNTSVSRRLFHAHGGFDPHIRHVNEDLECGLRFYDAGFRFVFDSRAIVDHRSTKDLVDYYVSSLESKGIADAYRLVEKKQRRKQNYSLTLIGGQHSLRGMLKSAYLRNPAPWIKATSLVQKAANATGWRSLTRLWAHIVDAYYWKGVRCQIVSKERLCKEFGAAIPVLTFHCIERALAPATKQYCVPPKRFRRFMSLLAAARYATVSVSDLLASPQPKKTILLTFDDGYDDFFTEAFPVLQALGFGATVFLVVGHIGGTNMWDRVHGHPERRLLDTARIRELSQYGIEFGSHSLTHPLLTSLSDSELRSELIDSKARLEDLLGKSVQAFAYPWGDVDARVRASVAQAGYKAAFTIDEGLNFWDDKYLARRVNVTGDDTIVDFVGKARLGVDVRASCVRYASAIFK